MQDFFRTVIEQFLQTSVLEWLATISGFLCVYLAAKQHILNWPISIISVAIYAYLFYHSKLYGDAILQIYFFGTAIYGWYFWRKISTQAERPIRQISRKQGFYILLAILGLTLCLGLGLDTYTDSDVPYIDAFCTAMSFVAQFLMTRKILQNWLLWIVVDLCYIPLYLHKNLLLTAVLYFAFTLVAWKGYQDWKKTYEQNLKLLPREQ